MQYIYSYLSGSDVGIIISSAIDRDSAEYAAWTAGELSLRDFLYYGIANSWIDTTKLNIESRYSDADDVFGALTDYLFEKLPENRAFSKKIYENLINGGVITGKELCLALYDQNILAYDENEVRMLRDNGPAYAFNFMVNKISNVEITPAQLALDPCMASCVVTDVNTGQVLALVSYPGYDTNRISDPEYLSRLNADLSYPLRNNATQTKKAPGSTFKPITAIAALEEGVVGLDELITCTGQYEEVALPIKCWIYPGHHGPLNVVGGLGNSCNYFMSEVVPTACPRTSRETTSPAKGWRPSENTRPCLAWITPRASRFRSPSRKSQRTTRSVPRSDREPTPSPMCSCPDILRPSPTGEPCSS